MDAETFLPAVSLRTQLPHDSGEKLVLSRVSTMHSISQINIRNHRQKMLLAPPGINPSFALVRDSVHAVQETNDTEKMRDTQACRADTLYSLQSKCAACVASDVAWHLRPGQLTGNEYGPIFYSLASSIRPETTNKQLSVTLPPSEQWQTSER